MRITQVGFRQFPPFADGTAQFPELAGNEGLGEVHLLTGQNGTGKTRLLCLLAAACGNSAPLDSRFAGERSSAIAVFGQHKSHHGLWIKRGAEAQVIWPIGPSPREDTRSVWERNATTVQRWVEGELTQPPHESVPTAALAVRGIARVRDTAISALASVKIGRIADHLTFEPAANEDQIICQSMANLKTAAAMDVLRNLSRTESRSVRLQASLEQSVSEITGRPFTFDLKPDPTLQLRVYWGGVAMSLMQLPDGLRSIIGWLVSCVAKLAALYPDHPDPLSVPLILLLDEPEGHLHPAWQRKVLPAAQTLFPQAQIFAATHSPFVISSVNDGWIHVFRADDSGTVTIDSPLPCSKGDTYIDVVEDVLGVKEWYDPETEALLADFRKKCAAVLESRGEGYDELAVRARVIADRSNSLKDLIAREMRQVDRMMSQAAASP